MYLEHNVENVLEILNRIMQSIMSIIISALLIFLQGRKTLTTHFLSFLRIVLLMTTFHLVRSSSCLTEYLIAGVRCTM